MKRVVSREFPISLRSINQYKEYNDVIAKSIPTIDIDKEISVPIKYNWCKKIVENMLLKGINISNALDIGCANGGMSAILASMRVKGAYALTVDAIEPYTDVYKKASETFSQCRKSGMRVNAYNVTFDEFESKHNYDIVVAFDIVEHTRDPLAFIESIYDILEVGGCLFISTPEQSGRFGLSDMNQYHYWTSTAQSIIFTLFNDDRKWKIEILQEYDGIIMLLVKKKNFMGV